MAFWAFIPFIFAFWWLASGVPPISCQKRFVFPRSHIKNLTAPGRAPFSDFWPLGLHFLLFWPCGPSFLAVWLCGPSFPLFWPFGLSFPFIVAFWAFIPFIFAFWWLASGVPPTSCQKRFVFPRSHIKNLTAPGRAPFSDFWPLGLHFLLFWPCGPSFLAVWLCGPSFSFILAFWAFISFHFGLHSLYFGLLVASLWGPDVSHSATEVKKPKKVFHYVMGSFGWVGCFQSNFNTWWGTILQTPMNPKP